MSLHALSSLPDASDRSVLAQRYLKEAGNLQSAVLEVSSRKYLPHGLQTEAPCGLSEGFSHGASLVS